MQQGGKIYVFFDSQMFPIPHKNEIKQKDLIGSFLEFLLE